MALSPTRAAMMLASLRQKDPLWAFLGGPAPMATAAQMSVIQSRKLYLAVVAGNRAGKSATVAAKMALKLRNLRLEAVNTERDLGFARPDSEDHPGAGLADSRRIRKAQDGSNGYDFVLEDVQTPRHYLLLAPSRGQLAQIWYKKLLLESELGGPAAPKDIKGQGFIPALDVKRIGWDYVGLKYPKLIEMKNGNTLVMQSVSDIHQWRRIQGVAYSHIFLDEGACTVELLKELYVRLEDEQNKGNHAGIDWAATITSAHAYEGYEEFLNRCRKACDGGVADPDHEVIELSVENNPMMTGEVMARMRRVLGEDEAKVRIEGQSRANEYQVFPQFDSAHHVAREPFEPSDRASIWIGYDPGVAHPTGMMFACFEPETPTVMRIWCYRDHKRQPISVDADVIAEVLQGRKVECLVTDPSAGNVVKSGNGEAVRTMLHRELQKRGVVIHQGMRSKFGQSLNDMDASIIDVRRWLSEHRIVFSPRAATAISQVAKWKFRPRTVYGGMGRPYDREDEACFPAGTLVLMADGTQRPIEEVCEDDEIMTPFGPQPVRAAGQTGVKLVGATKLTDRVLLSTGDHRILSDTWRRVDSIKHKEHVHIYRRAYRLDRLLTDIPDPELGRAAVSHAATCWKTSQRVVTPWSSLWPMAVYCLAVDAGCFYANGVLVSNCDTLRYLCRARATFVDRGENPATGLVIVREEDQSSANKRVAAGRRAYEGWLRRMGRQATPAPLFRS
jgi:hypothetical protein